MVWFSVDWSLDVVIFVNETLGVQEQPIPIHQHSSTSSPWSNQQKIHGTHRWKRNWTFLGKTCFITKNKVISPLESDLNSCVFSFQEKFNQQLQGAAMGSSIIVNIYMEYFRELALGLECPIPSPWWKRYVVNVISIAKNNQVITFFHHLNSVDPCITFTMKSPGTYDIILFPDIRFLPIKDDSIQTSVYRIPSTLYQLQIHRPCCNLQC